jgi:hypothetical protein
MHKAQSTENKALVDRATVPHVKLRFLAEKTTVHMTLHAMMLTNLQHGSKFRILIWAL